MSDLQKEMGALPSAHSKIPTPDIIPANCTTEVHDFVQVLTFVEDFAHANKKLDPEFNVIEDYKGCVDNAHRKIAIDGLESLASVFPTLGEKDYFIQGKVLEKFDGQLIPRRSGHAVEDEVKTILDAPSHWVAFDVDKTPLLTVGEWIKATLPEEFHESDHLIQYSSRYQPGKVLKAHVFFWLDQAMTTAQKKATFGEYSDESAFQAGQPLYVVAPTFVGCEDPVDQRIVLVTQNNRSVKVKLIITPDEKANSGKPVKDARLGGGVSATFHDHYSVEEVLALIPGEFSFDRNSKKRLTWLKSDSGAKSGAFVTPDRMHIGANHASWPWGSNTTANLWQILRQFAFGHLDSKEDLLLDESLRPSERACFKQFGLGLARSDFVVVKPEVVEPVPSDDADVFKESYQNKFLAPDQQDGEDHVEWVVPEIIAEGFVVIAGSGGVGKSTSIIPMAAIVAGLCPDGHPMKQRVTRNVVYVTEDVSQFRRIKSAMVKKGWGTEAQWKERFRVIAPGKTATDEIVAAAPEICKWTETHQHPFSGESVKVGPLLVIDTRNAIFCFDDENGNSQASEVISRVKTAYANAAGVWVVSHIAKAIRGRMEASELSVRGASAWTDDAHQTLFIVAEDERRYLIKGKTRFSSKISEIEFKREWHEEERFTLHGTERMIFDFNYPTAVSYEEVRVRKEEKRQEVKNSVLDERIEKVCRFIEANPRCKRDSLKESLGSIRNSDLGDVLSSLADQHILTKSREGRADIYSLSADWQEKLKTYKVLTGLAEAPEAPEDILA
jgi:hypothetical protein